MDTFHDSWLKKSRGPFRKSLTFADAGVVLGFDTVLVHRGNAGFDIWKDEERALCLLALLQRRPSSSRALTCLRRAVSLWEHGDKALAYFHLAFGKLPQVEERDDAWRLHQAAGLLDLGVPPRFLAKELGFDLPTGSLSKYNRDQPRNPAGSGDVSGRWAKDPVAAGSIAWAPDPQSPAASPVASAGVGALALKPATPSLLDTLAPEALEWLGLLVERLALPAAVFGAVFVPSANDGISQQGAVPDHPGLSYALDRDAGTLRLSLDGDADPGHALVAQLGADGVYRDVETKVPIARAVGGNAVLIDLDQAPAIADSDTTADDQPKLCPAPTTDRAGGRKMFDILYEQYVRSIANPQVQPPLAPGLAFALPADTPTGWVYYDDCREPTGTMIDAKGNYADMLAVPFLRDALEIDWLQQAKAQIDGAKGRAIEWYFHDMDAAVLAHQAFALRGYDDRISIHILPFPGGVPSPNPRVPGYPRSLLGGP